MRVRGTSAACVVLTTSSYVIGNEGSFMECAPAVPVFDEWLCSEVWVCPFCGKTNSRNTLSCGAGEWDGCGGSRPV